MRGSIDAGVLSEQELESYRRPLTGYCYRMLGSGSEAEDAVQETMIRAWRGSDRLQERAALKSWLYRIASNVCFDILQSAQRRAQPMDLGPSSNADATLGAGLPETTWVQPIADGRVLPDGASDSDPAAVVESRETLRLAFVAALQHLPPRQRAVLILREVLRWQATEVAELLDTSVASVNSALQRARATLESLDLDAGGGFAAGAPTGDAADARASGGDVLSEAALDDARERELLASYVDAFERYDIASLVRLLHDDAAFSMPPWPLWVEGPQQVHDFMLGTGAHCEGSRVLPISANGGRAVAVYHPTPEGWFDPWAIVVVETRGGRISGLHHFIYPELFAEFGLPARLEAGAEAASEARQEP
ncbi:MAG TPA: sigma-70 family RNA polymerase sigma factor [Conexibacter sp.]|jgi:RNA polymerase sigma-70 factor (ECF subfamily)